MNEWKIIASVAYWSQNYVNELVHELSQRTKIKVEDAHFISKPNLPYFIDMQMIL